MTILIKFTNNFSAPLASGISAGATSITLASGYGASLTNYAGGEYEYLTIYNAAGAVEIVKVTARSGDVLTVTRGEDGTTAQAWLAGDKVASRPCRAAMNDALQVNVAKANVDSQAFTGTPSLPTGTTGVTQTAGDSSTKLATTAFVTPAIASAVAAAGAGLATAKAWVVFDGTTGAIKGTAVNVSSVTRNGVGDYTVNLTLAMANANYAIIPSVSDYGTVNNAYKIGTLSRTTTSFGLRTKSGVSTFQMADVSDICVAVFAL